MMEEHGKKEEWFLEFLHRAEQLKCAPRHSWTSSGRRESVAEHSWRLGLAAWLLKEEFPQIDLERLLELCLLHDLGEAVTGDVPCFEKEAVHEREEERAVKRLAEILPEEKGREFLERLSEFEKGETVYDVLSRVCSYAGIQMEASWTPLYNSYYVEGINNLYEFDCGNESGWMYKVNGWFPNYGCSSYYLEDGDTIVWTYTCNGLGADVGGGMG